MIAHRFRAMGTSIEAWSGRSDVTDLIAFFEEVEQACSRFRSESELSRINRSPADRIVPGALLADVLAAGAAARELTAGVVDIGVDRTVCDWGYDRTFADVSNRDEEPACAPEGVWDFSGGTLTRAGTVDLDLGGVAKGWTCDRAVERGLAAVVSAGGDLRSSHPETMVSVDDPNGEVAFRMHVGEGALATSSVTRRTWQVAGRTVSHIIDPRSMRPVTTPVLSATVTADTALEAEVGAKTVLILGAEGLSWAASRPWISAAVAFWGDGSIYATPGLEVAA